MPQKPPAFQFYTKDWLTSHTINSMSLHDQGVYIRLLAVAWESDPQGTLPKSFQIVSKLAQIRLRNVTDFFHKWPQLWIENGDKYVNEKLYKIGLNYKEISEKRRKAAESRYQEKPAIVDGLHHSSSSSSSASSTTSKTKTKKEPLASLVPSPEFMLFWNSYPIHKAKQKAIEAWNKHVNGNAAEVIASIERLKPSRSWQEGYIPHPTTFLNQHRWTDEPDPPTAEEIKKQKRKKLMEDYYEQNGV